MTRVPVQQTRAGLCLPDVRAEDALRATFTERSCVTLPRFLDATLLARLQARVARAEWRVLVHDVGELSTELLLLDDQVPGTLALLVQDPALLAFVQRLTGCDPIGSFIGRVYRMDAGAGHHDVWHGDDDDNRMVGLSVNLSPGVYEGGVLELRERGSLRLLHRVANTGPGDAILFRIDHALEHRVTDVAGSASKIAFAGWFQRTPVVRLLGGPSEALS